MRKWKQPGHGALPAALTAAVLAMLGAFGAAGPGAAYQHEGHRASRAAPALAGPEEKLQYNNPFQQHVAPAWYAGKKVYHVHLDTITRRPPFPVAQQYLFVYTDQYRHPTTPAGFMAQPKVPGQYVVYDSVPGTPGYSPIWRNHWVLVPRSYKANSIRSVAGIRKSGYRVVDSPFYIN